MSSQGKRLKKAWGKVKALGFSSKLDSESKEDGANAQLPSGWVRAESRSEPGVFYFINAATGERTFALDAARTATDSPDGASGEAVALAELPLLGLPREFEDAPLAGSENTSSNYVCILCVRVLVCDPE
jgi:hypothetical protein